MKIILISFCLTICVIIAWNITPWPKDLKPANQKVTQREEPIKLWTLEDIKTMPRNELVIENQLVRFLTFTDTTAKTFDNKNYPVIHEIYSKLLEDIVEGRIKIIGEPLAFAPADHAPITYTSGKTLTLPDASCLLFVGSKEDLQICGSEVKIGGKVIKDAGKLYNELLHALHQSNRQYYCGAK